MTDHTTAHDLGTSAGGRAYIAEYFATQLRRHDFARYIENRLAADFACALAQHLSKLRAPVADDWQPIGTAPAGIRILLGPRDCPVVGVVRITWNPDSMENELSADVVHYNGTRLVAGYHCTEWAPLHAAPMPAMMADVTPPATARERWYYDQGRLAERRASAPVAGEAQHPDDAAVDRFAVAMKAKLAKKRREGRRGWDNKDECDAGFLSQLLRNHVDKGDPVDVGNLAMMLHQRGERIELPNPEFARRRIAAPQASEAVRELPEAEQRDLIGGYFAEDWAKEAAAGLLHDHARALAALPAQPEQS